MEPRDIVFQELTSNKVPGYKKVTGDAFMICCPFHGDTAPSCGVNLTTDTNIPLGFFHCFGCSEKGGWNKLAEKLGLQKLKDWQIGFAGNGTERIHKKRKCAVYRTEEQVIKEALYTQEAIEWPTTLTWRGYSGTLLRKMGALYYNDRLTDQLKAFFPITVTGKFRGGVRAYLEKQVTGNTYLTTKGSWVRSYGLLGYDYVQKVVRAHQYDALVLVEGPRDAMRLLDNRIPALAVLGSQNVSEQKILMTMGISSKLKTLYVMPDNDSGGAKFVQNVKTCAKDLIEVRHLKLPKPMKKGKLIKLDPDNCDQDIIDEVRILFREHRHA